MKFKEKFNRFYSETLESNDYLKIEILKNCFVYQIFARNAYIGVWIETEKSFMISRYKVGCNPYISFEYHWDAYIEDIFISGVEKQFKGTSKPLKLIEEFPFDLKEKYSVKETQIILNYLNKTEENNPVVEGFNSLKDRKDAAIRYEKKLLGELFSDAQLFRMIKSDHQYKKFAMELLKKRGYAVNLPRKV